MVPTIMVPTDPVLPIHDILECTVDTSTIITVVVVVLAGSKFSAFIMCEGNTCMRGPRIRFAACIHTMHERNKHSLVVSARLLCLL